MRHPHPMVPSRGADASVPGALSPVAAGGNRGLLVSARNGTREASQTQSQPSGSRAITLELPEPPAANRYLRTHGHVTYKTREAKAYCELVARIAHGLRVNGSPAFPDGDVSVRVVWYRGRKAGDLGERTKVLYDSLQGIAYTDDKQIAHDERWRVDAHAEIPKGHVRVEVSAV